MTDIRFEPEARYIASSIQDAALVSLAVSMKRIADTLSGNGQSMFTMPINMYGETIGEAIQGQLDRGLR